MAKQRLFPQRTPDADDTRTPHDKFSDLASKIVTVPKAVIDKRDKEWKHERKDG